MKRSRDIGRAKAVLVLGEGEMAKATVTAIEARRVHQRSGARVAISGPVEFDETALRQLNSVVTESVDWVLRGLGLELPCFEISVSNASSASMFDVGLQIRGFSADVSLYMAMLSAALTIPVEDGILFTGHIASPNGTVSPVSALNAKVDAALADPAVTTLVLPRLLCDEGLMSVSPAAAEAWERAVLKAKAGLRVHEVRNAAEVVAKGFTEESIVLGSLRSGFFEVSAGAGQVTGGSAEIVTFLATNNLERFWRVLERALLSSNAELAQDLLGAWIDYWAGRQTYPAGFGGALRRLLDCLPPSTRRTMLRKPLCTSPQCLRLTKLAGSGDLDDMRHFIETLAGETSMQSKDADWPPNARIRGARDPGSALDAMLAQIDPGTLARTVGGPIDDARGAYALTSSTLDGYDEFLEGISAFYLHLLRHSGRVAPGNFEFDPRPDALDLLKRAYAREGGIEAAWSNVKFGEQGGLRAVLDAMTDHFKQEEIQKLVNLVLKETFDPLAHDERLALVSDLLERLAPHLPAEFSSQPPERYAPRIEDIARAYATSIHNVSRLVRSM